MRFMLHAKKSILMYKNNHIIHIFWVPEGWYEHSQSRIQMDKKLWSGEIKRNLRCVQKYNPGNSSGKKMLLKVHVKHSIMQCNKAFTKIVRLKCSVKSRVCVNFLGLKFSGYLCDKNIFIDIHGAILFPFNINKKQYNYKCTVFLFSKMRQASTWMDLGLEWRACAGGEPRGGICTGCDVQIGGTRNCDRHEKENSNHHIKKILRNWNWDKNSHLLSNKKWWRNASQIGTKKLN